MNATTPKTLTEKLAQARKDYQNRRRAIGDDLGCDGTGEEMASMREDIRDLEERVARSKRVTFGKMDRSDASAPAMDILVDDVLAGTIEAQTTADETTRLVTSVRFKVTGYTVTLFNQEEEPTFHVQDGEDPRTALAAAKLFAKENA